MDRHAHYLTTPIIRELESLTRRVRERIGRRRAKRFAQIVRRIIRTGKVVGIRRRINICRDPSDDMYLEAALAARATVIITRDKDLLALGTEKLHEVGLGALRIQTPSEFLQQSLQ